MVEKRKTVTIFVAEDGKEFMNRHDCLSYEKEREVLKKRTEFLENVFKEELREVKEILCPVWIREEGSVEKIIDEIVVISLFPRCILGSVKNGSVLEFNENFPFGTNGWDKFKENMKVKYGYNVEIPISYFGK
jgi:hypothetical protein